jgi:hypothetical protein
VNHNARLPRPASLLALHAHPSRAVRALVPNLGARQPVENRRALTGLPRVNPPSRADPVLRRGHQISYSVRSLRSRTPAVLSLLFSDLRTREANGRTASLPKQYTKKRRSQRRTYAETRTRNAYRLRLFARAHSVAFGSRGHTAF